ncbi:MAG TPA: hypothetical protein VMW83_08275 [Spirochaetia bacterium]|nr:hypothetical protein [Spirochaetia bacterium]
MNDLEQYVRIQLIAIIRGSPEWKRETHPQLDNINNQKVKDAIRARFPETKIHYWKKEYARWFYRDGSIVGIHRCVNRRNGREEFDVKIKWIRKRQEIERLVDEIRAENQRQITEVVEYYEQAAVVTEN